MQPIEIYREPGAGPAAPSYLVWTAPGAPVRILLDLAAVLQIRQDLTVPSGPVAGGKCGGLLLGEFQAPDVWIDRIVPLFAGASGTYFVQSGLGEQDLASYIAERNGREDGDTVVGYYRRDGGTGIRLFGSDLAFFRTFFKAPHNVFLVACLEESSPPVAGFFFWQNDFIFSACSLREFLFDDKTREAGFRPAPAVEPTCEADGAGAAPTGADSLRDHLALDPASGAKTAGEAVAGRTNYSGVGFAGEGLAVAAVMAPDPADIGAAGFRPAPAVEPTCEADGAGAAPPGAVSLREHFALGPTSGAETSGEAVAERTNYSGVGFAGEELAVAAVMAPDPAEKSAAGFRPAPPPASAGEPDGAGAEPSGAVSLRETLTIEPDSGVGFAGEALAAAAVMAPDPADEDAAGTRASVRRAIFAALSAAPVLGIGAYLLASRFAPPDVPGPPAIHFAPRSLQAGLTVRESGNDFNLAWSGLVPAVAEARLGRLTMEDGKTRWEVLLAPEQLRSGGISSPRRTGTIGITLDLFHEDGSVVRETVALPAADAVRSTRAANAPTPPERQPEQTRRFVLPPAGGSVPSPLALPGLDPAPASVSPPETRIDLPRLDLTGNPWPAAPAAAPGAAPIERRPPVPIRQIPPVLPPNLQAMLTSRSTIQILVRVDASGKVTGAEPLASSGSMGRILGAAAASAARLWVFEPARDGGRSVPGELIIEFSFLAGKAK